MVQFKKYSDGGAVKMKRILLISLGLLAFALFSKGQTWDWATHHTDIFGEYYYDDLGNSYAQVSVSDRKRDSVIYHSNCCPDTVRNRTETDYNRYIPFNHLIKLNAAGKLAWQTKDSFSVDVVNMKIIDQSIYVLGSIYLSIPNSQLFFNNTVYTFPDSLSGTYFYSIMEFSLSGEPINYTPLLNSTRVDGIDFNILDDDFLVSLDCQKIWVDGIQYFQEYQTSRILRINENGELIWSVDQLGYSDMGNSRCFLTQKNIFTYTRNNISRVRNAPMVYKFDFDGNVLDSLDFESQKLTYQKFGNINGDRQGNIYMYGLMREPTTVDGQLINVLPNTTAAVLIKLDSDLNYSWHKIVAEDNIENSFLTIVTPNDDIWCSVWISDEGGRLNGVTFNGGRYWVKYSDDGGMIEIIYPQTNPTLTFAGREASYWKVWEPISGDLFLSGSVFGYDSEVSISFDDIEIKTPHRKQTFFTAKRNRKLLKLSKANIACRSDSLELAFDPVYKKFEWYFTDSSCTIPQYEGKKIRPNNLVAGEYPVLVRAYVNDSLYWCLKDTIHIIDKPVADFTTPETVVCAFQPIVFTDESTSDTVNATREEKWVWTFGDGTSETVSRPFDSALGDLTPIRMTHTYTRPGTYTVSLFYSNGFCDSTLTKNQYITVVDAPAPGFRTDNDRGCSPYTVIISDTITKNTTKKEYNFSDGRGWVEVAVNQESFDVTYVDAGTFWITQRLYGYTGCVTQQDSARIYVTPGFTDSDTSHINNATYQDVPAHPAVSEIITVSWPCLLEDSSVRYHLYRNNQKIAELGAKTCIYGQIAYQDSLKQVSKSLLTYSVLAIDSCGTATQVGRVGKPVRVSGEVLGNNELSVISYTTYQDWNIGKSELNYELQTEDIIGGWKTINDQTGTAQYRDKQFLDMTKDGIQIEKCYRVVASVGTSKASISNILCLPYSPVIFIPTAFSPNADNLNDVYRPVTFGIEQYQMQIYNRYGQQIADLDQTSAGWDAADTPQGAYMVIIRAKGTDNEWYNLKSTVTVIR